ncbi:MAG: DUF3088 domain-containing protein [Chromatiales bacterium]|jgi:hypothetical protein|nr:DUF3088 domain-containing protein [Chromatiales bacterium]
MANTGRDTLLLLEPDFTAEGRRCYCPACATVEGILGYYPALRAELDVRYIGFARPRAAVIELIGAANQGLPALVLAPGTPPDAIAGLAVREANGREFLQGPADIGRYLARRYGIGEPH